MITKIEIFRKKKHVGNRENASPKQEEKTVNRIRPTDNQDLELANFGHSLMADTL